MTTQLETLDLQPETVEQEEIEKMAGGIPGEIESILTAYLFPYVYPKKLGRLFGAQTDFQLGGIGKRRPDVAFVALSKLPINVPDAVPFPPDLAVEVISKTDGFYEVAHKVNEYLSAGVRLVWIIRPLQHLIEVYHPGDLKPFLLGLDDELEGEDVIPGFKLPVKALFEYEIMETAESKMETLTDGIE